MAQPNYYYSRCRGLAVQLKIRWNLGGCSSDLHWWCDGLDIQSVTPPVQIAATTAKVPSYLQLDGQAAAP